MNIKVTYSKHDVKNLSAEEYKEMITIEEDYLKEIETNSDAGMLPKYKKYWEYVFRWRYHNKNSKT